MRIRGNTNIFQKSKVVLILQEADNRDVCSETSTPEGGSENSIPRETMAQSERRW